MEEKSWSDQIDDDINATFRSDLIWLMAREMLWQSQIGMRVSPASEEDGPTQGSAVSRML